MQEKRTSRSAFSLILINLVMKLDINYHWQTDESNEIQCHVAVFKFGCSSCLKKCFIYIEQTKTKRKYCLHKNLRMPVENVDKNYTDIA
jgi:hypothetical protein